MSMNLRAIANTITQTVNDNTSGDVWRSDGYTTADDGKRTPTFARVMEAAAMQVQALTSGELEHLDSLNIQGVNRAAYVNGELKGVDRVANAGGDVLAFGGQWWLVAVVLEPWTGAGWTKAALAQLNGKPAGIS